MAINAGIFGDESAPDRRFVRDIEEVGVMVQNLKALGVRIVLTQGTWDMVHIGHSRYLGKGKEHGDMLIVAVDSDRWTSERKGPNRPVIPEDERVEMLCELRHVDLVTIIDSLDESDKLLELVSPDVLIISKTTRNLPQERLDVWNQWCGEIVLLEPQAQTHTSQRVRELAFSGAEELMKVVDQSIKNFFAERKEGK